MRIRACWQAASEVDELCDSARCHIADRAALKLPALPGQLTSTRKDLEEFLSLLPVGCEVIFTAKEIIVHPGYARLAD